MSLPVPLGLYEVVHVVVVPGDSRSVHEVGANEPEPFDSENLTTPLGVGVLGVARTPCTVQLTAEFTVV